MILLVSYCDNKLEPRQQVAFEEDFFKVVFIFLYFEVTKSEFITSENEIEMARHLGMVEMGRAPHHRSTSRKLQILFLITYEQCTTNDNERLYFF